MNVDTVDISEPEHDVVSEISTEKEVYTSMIQKLNYHNYSDTEPVQREEVSRVGGPRVITPDEFGDEGYKIVELTYWGDNVLTDHKNKRIQDVDALLGSGTIEQFGKYEDDCLHVRDDEKKIDFEILRDLKRYSDFYDDSPHPAEGE